MKMPDDSLWYLIFMGGLGLVLVFVGCFIVPMISFLCKWRYPPLSEEDQIRLNDANDPKLQALFLLVEKNAVYVSDIDLNKVSQKNGEHSPSDQPNNASSESNRSLSSSSNMNLHKPHCKKKSVRDLICTSISSALDSSSLDGSMKENKPSSTSKITRSKNKSSQAKHHHPDNDDNAGDEYDDLEAANSGSNINDANMKEPKEQEKGRDNPGVSHASLNSQNHNCAICLEEYHHPTNNNQDEDEEQQVIRATGGCIHYFHKNCMKSLIRSRARKGIYEVVPCPICRLPFFAPSSWNMQVKTNSSSSNSAPREITTDANANPTNEIGGVGRGNMEPTVGTTASPSSDNNEASSTENAISVPASASLPSSSTSAEQETSQPIMKRDRSTFGTHQPNAVKNPKEDDFNPDGDSTLPERTPIRTQTEKKRKGKRKSKKDKKGHGAKVGDNLQQ